MSRRISASATSSPARGELLHSVDLVDAPNLTEVRTRLEARLERNPDSGAGTKAFWLRGTGWDQDLYGRVPAAKDLDEDASPRGLST